MFGRLFGRKRTARRGDDHVWASAAARKAGLLRAAERFADERASVLVVALDVRTLEELAGALAARSPVVCRDVFGQSTLRARLAQPGALTLALASALPQPAGGAKTENDPPPVPLELLVLGRHEQREHDDAIAAFADGVGERARVTFHMSFDDPLLASHAGAIKGLLEKLGMRDDEATAHPLVTRSIEAAQRGQGRR